MSESTGSCDHSPDRKFGTGIPVTPWKRVRCCTGLANSNPHPYPCIPVTHYHGFTRTRVMPYLQIVYCRNCCRLKVGDIVAGQVKMLSPPPSKEVGAVSGRRRPKWANPGQAKPSHLQRGNRIHSKSLKCRTFWGNFNVAQNRFHARW